MMDNLAPSSSTTSNRGAATESSSSLAAPWLRYTTCRAVVTSTPTGTWTHRASLQRAVLRTGNRELDTAVWVAKLAATAAGALLREPRYTPSGSLEVSERAALGTPLTITTRRPSAASQENLVTSREVVLSIGTRAFFKRPRSLNRHSSILEWGRSMDCSTSMAAARAWDSASSFGTGAVARAPATHVPWSLAPATLSRATSSSGTSRRPPFMLQALRHKAAIDNSIAAMRGAATSLGRADGCIAAPT
mmetsp:Transcript_4862/g.8853  ORF Transcript_4862/g.8853 Transcript_4862/m.8853 type:complete len:248 (-) Transcript_4862:334-1077(-)